MGAVRALSRRVTRIERAARAKPSPFVVMYGSFDVYLEKHVLPDIESGRLDPTDMVFIIAALRAWETDLTWARAS